MQGQLVFAIDLGLNNVGWCAQRQEKGEVEICAAGTYVFASSLVEEGDATSGLKSRDRGLKRRARRTLRRRVQRKRHLYDLLAKLGMMPRKFVERDALLSAYHTPASGLCHPYALRTKALDQALTPMELGRVFAHFNQKRGFMSPRKLMALDFGEHLKAADEATDDKSEETGMVLGEIEKTRNAMVEVGCRTLGEYLNYRIDNGLPVRKKKLKDAKPKEQKDEDEKRFNRAEREMLVYEFNQIVKVQRRHHALLTDQVISQIGDVIFAQRQLKADMNLRGKCSFFIKEFRAPRAGLTAQRYSITQEVAHLRWQDPRSDGPQKLTSKQRTALVAVLMNGQDHTWDEVRKITDLPILARFETEPDAKKSSKSGSKPPRSCQTVTRIRGALGSKWDNLDDLAQRNIVDILVSVRDWKQDPSADLRPAARRRFDLFEKGQFGTKQITFSTQEAADLATLVLPEGYISVSTKLAKNLFRSCWAASQSYCPWITAKPRTIWG